QEEKIASLKKELVKAKSIVEMLRPEITGKAEEIKSRISFLKNERKKGFTGLRSEKSEISAIKKNVLKLIKKDVSVLKNKEKEVVKLVDDVEKEKQLLDAKQDSIMKKIRELEHAKVVCDRKEKALKLKESVIKRLSKELDLRKKKLEKESAQIKRARDLKKVLPKMEKRFRELTRELRKLEKKVKERPVVIEKPAVKEVLPEIKLPSKPFVEMPQSDIRSMIKNARNIIDSGDLGSADRLVSEIAVRVKKVSDPVERKLLDYELKDLKTSIKLASLA
ncbi:hypothetical protein B6U93_04605, partial [Candidatus Woesearchaeota archaeon ex4484_78]